MKHLFGAMSVIFSMFIANHVMASETIEGAAAKAAAQQYLLDTLKDYINNRSTEAAAIHLGDQVSEGIGYALGAYNLTQSETDKEKFWSTLSLAASSNPYAAIAVTVLRVTDAIISAKAAARVAKIYEEIEKINTETFSIYKEILDVRFNDYNFYISRFSQELIAIYSLSKNSCDQLKIKSGDAQIISSCIKQIIELQRSMRNVIVYAHYVMTIPADVRERYKNLGNEQIQKLIEEHSLLLTELEGVTISLQKNYGHLLAQSSLENIKNELKPHYLNRHRTMYCRINSYKMKAYESLSQFTHFELQKVQEAGESSAADLQKFMNEIQRLEDLNSRLNIDRGLCEE
ncbi:MAG: hypothetical protein KDD50_08900 [Bdellovibrionales bacterium]|nr:hypothetical protein [Bdellovibrionales bacterium]